MRRFLKFLHTLGAVGFMGAVACLLVLARLAPPTSALNDYALLRGTMAEIAAWVVLPSFILTLIPGLLSMAVTPAFLNAGWPWVKAATGIIVFAGGLHALAPIQDEARLSAQALAGKLDPATLTGISAGEMGTLWLLLAVSLLNIALGIWRPRLMRASAVTRIP